MTRSEFLKPYLMLVIQPWGKRYGMQTPEGELQSDLYFKRLGHANPYVWEALCELFAQGDHWPSIDEIKLAMRQNSRDEKPKKLPGPEVPEDYPPRLIREYANTHNLTVRDACLKLLPTWLREHPEDPERERVAAFLAQAESAPVPNPLLMPRLDDPAPRHEWVTGVTAEGCRGVCPKCREGTREVLVCWCHQEACRACLGVHVQTCRIGRIVNEA